MQGLFSARRAARFAFAVALVGLGAVTVSGASAQTYPDRRITFVVPYPA